MLNRENADNADQVLADLTGRTRAELESEIRVLRHRLQTRDNLQAMRVAREQRWHERGGPR